MPIIILSPLPMLSHLILMTALRVRYYYYPHHRDKETEAQTAQFDQGHKASEWWSWNSKPSEQAPVSEADYIQHPLSTRS